MFTGIIQEVGKVSNITTKNEGKYISIQTSESFLKDVKRGDSICVNGVCQTVNEIKGNIFTVFASKQTLEITTLSNFKNGEAVNLEKALKIGQGLDGHLVTGHVEGKGVVKEINKQGEGYLLKISIDEKLTEHVINKGSIAVDGISLTVYQLSDNIITISIIPETYNRTNLKYKNIGSFVNIETDIIGKYVLNYLKNSIFKNKEKNKITLEFLQKNGFI